MRWYKFPLNEKKKACTGFLGGQLQYFFHFKFFEFTNLGVRGEREREAFARKDERR